MCVAFFLQYCGEALPFVEADWLLLSSVIVDTVVEPLHAAIVIIVYIVIKSLHPVKFQDCTDVRA